MDSMFVNSPSERPNVMQPRVLVSFLTPLAVFLTAVPGTASNDSRPTDTPPANVVSMRSDHSYIYRLIGAAESARNFGSAVKLGRRSVVIYGVAYPTAPVKRLLDRAPAGVSARWARCAYTLTALERESSRLIESNSVINSIGPSRNASELTVGTLNKGLLSSYHPGTILDTTFAVKVFKQAPAGG
jgi:hypothetical protein